MNHGFFRPGGRPGGNLQSEINALGNDMNYSDNCIEIEASILVLGIAYASSLVSLIVWMV